MLYMKSKLLIVTFSLHLLQLFTIPIMLLSSLAFTITACYYSFPVSRASSLERFTIIKLNKTTQHTPLNVTWYMSALGVGGVIKEEICSRKTAL